jgi:Cof subfamily protein (haloacid dehalogenase superfamily)
VHERDRSAIDELRADGVTVAIATGRSPAATLHVARHLRLEGPCVCTDGAMIVDAQSGRLHHHRPLGGASSAAVARAMAPFPNISATVLIGETAVLDEASGMLDRVARAWSPNVETTGRLLDHPCWRSEEGITAGAIVGIDADIAAIADALAEQPLQITRVEVMRANGVSSLIVHGSGVSKGKGLAWLAAHYGVSMAETMAVGDWHNDIPMLEAAAHGFAMAHAPEPVKQAADHVLEATREGGAIAEIAARRLASFRRDSQR